MNKVKWNTAKTPFFEFVTAQLSFCQVNAASRILCDASDLGKTHTAVEYAGNNKNAVYIDCSQVKTKQRLIRYIAREFGAGHTGTYNVVYADLISYVRQIKTPLVILDEFGDLEYDAFLECKALWNALEGVCGWYALGADGLRKKIDTRIEHRKVGYTEIFSRYGNKYQKASPDGSSDFKSFKIANAALIIQANFPDGTDIKKVIAAADFTLRNLKDEQKKLTA